MESNYTKVHSNLTQCRTEVQKELETISQWFRLPTSQEHPDYCMKDLLATCRATMRNINARYDQATIKIEDQTCSYWRGRTFSYFNEILVILLNNAFNHTGYKQELEKLEIGLKLIEDERLLRLNMMTNLSDEVDIEEVQTKTREIREKLRQYTYTKRAYSKDSGSGYIKIMNMLQNYIAPQDYVWMNFGVETDKQHFFTDIIIEKRNITGEEKIEVIAD